MRQPSGMREEQSPGGIVKFYFRSTDALFSLVDIILASITALLSFFWFIASPQWQRLSAAFALISILLYLIRMVYRWNSAREESLLVIPGLGLQVERLKYSGAQTSRFVEKDLIRAVMVNEGIQGFRAYYYLVVMLKTEKRLILPFERFAGKAEELFRVWKRTNEILDLPGR